MYFNDEVMREERGGRGRAAAVMRFRVRPEVPHDCVVVRGEVEVWSGRWCWGVDAR